MKDSYDFSKGKRGAVAAATGLVTMESVEAAIGHAFSGKAAAKNIEAARIAFECTKA